MLSERVDVDHFLGLVHRFVGRVVNTQFGRGAGVLNACSCNYEYHAEDKRMTPVYRHKKTKGYYNLLMTGKLEKDGEAVCIYRSMSDFSVWVRPELEFHDGGFELVDPRELGGQANGQRAPEADPLESFVAKDWRRVDTGEKFEVLGLPMSEAVVAKEGDTVFFEVGAHVSDDIFKRIKYYIDESLNGSGIRGVVLAYPVAVARREKPSDN